MSNTSSSSSSYFLRNTSSSPQSSSSESHISLRKRNRDDSDEEVSLHRAKKKQFSSSSQVTDNAIVVSNKGKEKISEEGTSKQNILERYQKLEKIFEELNNLEDIKNNTDIITEILKITSKKQKKLSPKDLRLLPKSVQSKYKKLTEKIKGLETKDCDKVQNLCEEISKNRKDYIDYLKSNSSSHYNQFKKAHALGLVPNINPEDIKVYNIARQYAFFNQQDVMIRLLLLDDNANILETNLCKYQDFIKEDMDNKNFIRIYSQKDKKNPHKNNSYLRLDYSSYHSFYNQPKKIQNSFIKDKNIDGVLYGNFFRETDEKKKEFTNNDGSINSEAYRQYNPESFIEEMKENKKKRQEEKAQRQKEQEVQKQKEQEVQRQKEQEAQRQKEKNTLLKNAFTKELLNVQAEFRTKDGINDDDYKEYKEKRDEDLKQRKFTNFLGAKFKEYYEDVKRRGFKTPDNKIDIKTHNQFLQEDAETQEHYTNADGMVNIEAYKTRNALFGE